MLVKNVFIVEKLSGDLIPVDSYVSVCCVCSLLNRLDGLSGKTSLVGNHKREILLVTLPIV